ncbi:MAG: PepSY-like domain-containing protein [Bacteroidetes bacterium]|nr:PepSY-like domain-containing protein [Bacteroidota bacterium]
MKSQSLSFLLFALAGVFLLGCKSNTAVDEEIGDIPAVVKNNFQSQYTKSTEVEWEAEGDYYEAEFLENGKEMSAVYDTQGNLIETETEIEMDALPADIFTYISETHPNAELEEAESIENQEGNFYEVMIEDENDSEIELLFDPDGMLISSTIEEDNLETEDEEMEEQETNIEISALPESIAIYIADNYAGFTIQEAELEETGEGTFYDIELKNEDGNTIELVFDQMGNFLEIEEDDD